MNPDVITPGCRVTTTQTAHADLHWVAGPRKNVVSARIFWPIAATSGGAHAVAMQAVLGSMGTRRLETLGAMPTGGVTETACFLDIRAPRETIRAALRVAVTLIREGVDAGAVEAARTTVLHQLDRRWHDLKTVAVDAFRAAWSVPGGPLSRSPLGIPARISDLKPGEINAILGALANRRAQLIVVGDGAEVAQSAYLEAIEGLGGGAVRAPVAGPVLAPHPPGSARVASPLAGQGHLIWGVAVQIAGVEEHVALELAQHVLGGWTGARWQVLFREQLGYSYGTNAAVTTWRFGTRLVCMAHIGMSVSARVLETTRELLRKQAVVPDPAELVQARLQLLRSEALFFDSSRYLMNRAAEFLQAGLGPDFAAQRMELLHCLDLEGVRDTVRRLLGDAMLVTVGSGAAHG